MLNSDVFHSRIKSKVVQPHLILRALRFRKKYLSPIVSNGNKKDQLTPFELFPVLNAHVLEFDFSKGERLSDQLKLRLIIKEIDRYILNIDLTSPRPRMGK